VPNLGTTRATKIMLEAHNRGKAVVTTCPLELAELYRDRLESCGLTATIEKA
jgi:ATP-dependent Clp protease adapter protein ClpS